MVHSNTLNHLFTSISFVQQAGPLIFYFDLSVTYPRDGEGAFLGHDRHKFMLRNSIPEHNMGTAFVIEYIDWSRLPYG